MEKFNVDSPDWFNIYSDDMVLKTKFEIKEGIFLKAINYESLEFGFDNVCRNEVIQIVKITEKSICMININDNYHFKVKNIPAVISELQENFLKIIAVDGKNL